MEFYRKNNLICIIDRDDHESYEHFVERCHFVTSQTIKNDADYNRAVLFSRIYSNHKYLKCSYDDNIMIELDKMKKNLDSSSK